MSAEADAGDVLAQMLVDRLGVSSDSRSSCTTYDVR
jgi:hypothetical protein